MDGAPVQPKASGVAGAPPPPPATARSSLGDGGLPLGTRPLSGRPRTSPHARPPRSQTSSYWGGRARPRAPQVTCTDHAPPRGRSLGAPSHSEPGRVGLEAAGGSRFALLWDSSRPASSLPPFSPPALPPPSLPGFFLRPAPPARRLSSPGSHTRWAVRDAGPVSATCSPDPGGSVGGGRWCPLAPPFFSRRSCVPRAPRPPSFSRPFAKSHSSFLSGRPGAGLGGGQIPEGGRVRPLPRKWAPGSRALA